MNKAGHFIPLPNFLKGIYAELVHAHSQAQALQIGYLNRMAEHPETVSMVGNIEVMRVDLLSMTIHFKIVDPPFSWLERLMLFFALKESYPEGVYLVPATAEEANYTFNVTLNTQDSHNRAAIEKEMDKSVKYYVAKIAK